MNRDIQKIWVAGHNGMVGSAVTKELLSKGYDVVTVERSVLDLSNQSDVQKWLSFAKPDSIIFAAAKVGGIYANSTFPAEFIYNNLIIQLNVIHAAHVADVNRLIFLGSSCIYPKYAEQPIKEAALLTGPLEPTNEWYAIAKIAGIKLCQAYKKQYARNYISIMPCNLYGPNDNYDINNSHVLPALIRKFHEAKIANSPEVKVWGTGNPRREFMHVNDLAKAIAFCLKNYNEYEQVNCGYGTDISIRELATLVAKVVGFNGIISYDTSKPDGTPKKLMDSSSLRSLGWMPEIALEEGIKSSYDDFLKRVTAGNIVLNEA